MSLAKLIARAAPLALALGAGVALAGGPLLVDPATATAYHYGPAPVPVYYDLGNYSVSGG